MAKSKTKTKKSQPDPIDELVKLDLLKRQNVNIMMRIEKAQKRIDKWQSLNDPSAILDLSDMKLLELPPIPLNCQSLDCRGNKLTQLPKLPNCTKLVCYKNKLTSLPELPNCTMLICYYNQLTHLPDLPQCQTITCHHNNLVAIPELPNCKQLQCYFNQLTHLPNLPKCESLMCNHNKLVTLPRLLKCRVLYCYNNNLITLPILPACYNIGFDDNKYLHIPTDRAKKYHCDATPNYNRAALKIQKVYVRFIRNKYLSSLAEMRVLCENVEKICSFYVI